jgi:hypothetical protein
MDGQWLRTAERNAKLGEILCCSRRTSTPRSSRSRWVISALPVRDKGAGAGPQDGPGGANKHSRQADQHGGLTAFAKPSLRSSLLCRSASAPFSTAENPSPYGSRPTRAPARVDPPRSTIARDGERGPTRHLSSVHHPSAPLLRFPVALGKVSTQHGAWVAIARVSPPASITRLWLRSGDFSCPQRARRCWCR